MTIWAIRVWHSGCIYDISGRHYGASASPVNRVNVGTAFAPPPQVRGRASGQWSSESEATVLLFREVYWARFSIEGVGRRDCRADGAVDSRAVKGGSRQLDAAAVQPLL